MRLQNSSASYDQLVNLKSWYEDLLKRCVHTGMRKVYEDQLRSIKSDINILHLSR